MLVSLNFHSNYFTVKILRWDQHWTLESSVKYKTTLTRNLLPPHDLQSQLHQGTSPPCNSSNNGGFRTNRRRVSTQKMVGCSLQTPSGAEWRRETWENRIPPHGKGDQHQLFSWGLAGSLLPLFIFAFAAPRLGSSCNMKQTFTALDTFLFYYCQSEKATLAQQATSKIFPKNNSVQNRSVSEFKKKKETFTWV